MQQVKTVRKLTVNGNSPALTIPRIMVDALGWKPRETELTISLTEEGLHVRRASDTDSGKTVSKPK